MRFKYVIIFIIVFLFSWQPVYAQDTPKASDVATLQQELSNLEKQIASYEKMLSLTKKQRVKIAGLIDQLKRQRMALQEQIRLSTLSLGSLQRHIDSVLIDIGNQAILLQKMHNELSSLMRLVSVSVSHTPFESLVVHKTLSSYLDEQERLGPILGLLQLKFISYKAILAQLNEKKHELKQNSQELEHSLHKQSIQHEQLVENTQLQTALLTKTKQKEKTTAQQLTDSKAKAKAIRNRIYELFNVGKQISFGAAYEIAKWVANQYRIRPAYLLAIVTQESNLGKNVGTCNRATDPPEKHWRVIMKPSRDHEPFLAITKELDLDPNTTAVSCPMIRNGKQIGWGGGMGPAQFIPSTWMGYRNKVRAVTGKTPNPWDIRDAFIAAASKLSNDGATVQGTGEFNAALRYFSGSVDLTYRFYGDNVRSITERYEKDIQQLEKFSN